MAPDPNEPSIVPLETAGKRHPAKALRNYLIAGLMIWIPVMVTVWVIRFLSGILDQSLVLLPPPWRPEALVGTYVPGVGIILSLLLLLVTGMVARNLFGGQMLASLEGLIRRIPVVGAVYSGAKTFSETVLTDKGRSFKQVVMVQFPRAGIYSVGFITSEELEEVQAKTAEDVVCVFVPTTPNPTTGFIVLVPRDQVVVLDMTVDEAFRMLLTLGVVVPKWKNKPQTSDLALQQPPP
ncbi:MAG TPA: DUF502 domain-containing protein [Steroidobacteraceae bacterium]|nr:DUF502 domain-containing protein [Steroidobacteraceae bacterium]